MSTLLIKNSKVVGRNEVFEGYSVLVKDGKIAEVRKGGGITADETVDAEGKYIAAGFIDVHMHGAHGIRIGDPKEKIEEFLKLMPSHGVTGLLAGISPSGSDEKDVEKLEEYSTIQSQGTGLLGFFLEGHFLTLFGAIAHIPKNRTVERVKELKAAAKPYKLAFAVSPELDGITQMLPEMTKDAYTAFITHTGANWDEAEAAIEAGAKHASHFFNVFPYTGDKEPGVRGCGSVEAVYAHPEVSVDFILDGVHVIPIAVKMALACKDKDKVCLISDSNVHAGLPAGEYYGVDGVGITVEYEGAPARLKEGKLKGGLSGSGLTMDKAVRNAVDMLDVDLPQAVAMASYNPAKVLGIEDRKGLVKDGYDADIVMLNGDLSVEKCWVGGKLKYERK